MFKTKILLGTNNRKKGIELSELLFPYEIGVCTLADFKDKPEVIEDGKTFIENARKKAIENARFFGMITIGEDSGLSVDTLGGEPGIYSARFASNTKNLNTTDEANNKLLLEKLASEPLEKRTAFYTCAAVIADSSGKIIGEAEQYCRGRILFELSGNEGFGYDPLFEIIEYHKTFGALCPAVKRAISHRARTMRKLIPIIISYTTNIRPFR
ncbi:MAG: non-canonical purine NTP pyrophosphatase [Planctomycetaceae bacterium]|jgi:XTP/dITP diphosphohydrolase|nr:non-canonical purine NTP pyrophosphatase [Planctomycetaceae bacterium]